MYTNYELLEALQKAANAGEVEAIQDLSKSPDEYPSLSTYTRRFGGVAVAAHRGSIDIDYRQRTVAMPLTTKELDRFVALIPRLDPYDQALSMVCLLTGCAPTEHQWVDEHGIEKTETDSLVLYPVEAERGNRSVSVGPLYNNLVRVFDHISPKRLMNSITYSKYPQGKREATRSLRRISGEMEFELDRPVTDHQYPSRRGVEVYHSDIRCTHYLFERCQGASEAMLQRRLGLSDTEIDHYNQFLDDDEQSWSVRIEWRD